VANLLEQVQGAGQSAGIATAIQQQLGNLTGIGSSLDALTSQPPSAIGDMVGHLNGVGLPSIPALDALTSGVSNIRGMLPAQSSDLISGLSGGLDGLESTLKDKIIKPVGDTIDAIKSLVVLITGKAVAQSQAPAQAQGGAARGAPAAAGRTPVLAAPAPAPPAAGSSAAQTETAADAITGIKSVLDQLPHPLTVWSLLDLSGTLFEQLPTPELAAGTLPGISNFQFRLATIRQWRGMDGTQIAAAIVQTLQSLAQFIHRGIDTEISTLGTDATPLVVTSAFQSMQTSVDALVAGMQQIGAAVQAGNLSGVTPVLTALQTNRQTLDKALAALQPAYTGAAAQTLTGRLQRLPALLDGRIREVLNQLLPASDLPVPAPDLSTIDALIPDADISALTDRIKSLGDGIAAIVSALDIEAIRPTVKQAVAEANSMVGGLDDAIIGLRSQLTSLFDKIEAPIAALDTAAVVHDVETQLNSLRDTLKNTIGQLFDPVKAALTDAIGAVSTVADKFDPQSIVAPLTTASNDLKSLFESSDVATTLHDGSEALDKATKAIQDLSFKPITDKVIGDIDDVEKTLKKVDVSKIPAPARELLSSALQVIPKTLDPVIKTLTDKLKDAIESGPEPVLEKIKQGPALVTAEINKLSPDKLIGDQIDKPFNELLDKLAGFNPTALLKPVEDALADLRKRLQAFAPGQLLQPVEKLRQDLLDEFDKLNPAQLVAPINDRIHEVTGAIVGALPIDATLAPLDEVANFVGHVLAGVDAAHSLLDRLISIEGGLADPASQVDAVVNDILSRIGQIPDEHAFDAPLAGVVAAIDAVKADPIRTAAGNALAPLTGGLNTLDPQRRYGDLVRAYRGISKSAVSALPDSAEKTATLTFLNAFDPQAPAYAGPFTAVQGVRDGLTAATTTLNTRLNDWDSLYHGANGPFAAYRSGSVSKSDLQHVIGGVLRPSIAEPVDIVFALINCARQVLDAVLKAIEPTLAAIDQQLTSLLLLPTALHSIGDAVKGLEDHISHLDLSMISDELANTFALVRGKLAAFDPAKIADNINNIFNAVIGQLDVTKLLPQDQLGKLDGSYNEIVTKLRALKPREIIINATQALFDAAVKPVLDILTKLTALVNALIKKLDDLAGELNEELSRTNAAFGEMLKAIPLDGGGASASVGA
jgi:hypothetical protein